MKYVIDGDSAILGRISSSVAKLLLEGNEVALINAEKIGVSGHMRGIVEKYKRLVELKDKANPEHSPYISRRPDMFVKRVIRGMLPYRRPRGKAAYKLLKVYMGVPQGLKSSETYDIKSKRSSETYENTFTVKEIMEKLGYRL